MSNSKVLTTVLWCLGKIHILHNQLKGGGGVSQMLIVDDIGTKNNDSTNNGGVSEIKYLYFQFIDIDKLYQNNKYSRGMQNDSNIVRRIWDPSNNHLTFGQGYWIWTFISGGSCSWGLFVWPELKTTWKWKFIFNKYLSVVIM